MNCKQFEELVHGNLSPEALHHAASCPECSSFFADSRALQSSLAALREHDRAAEAPPQLEFYLRAAFLGARAQAASAPRAAHSWILPSVVGLAAVVLFGFLLVAVFLDHNSGPIQVVVAPPAPATEIFGKSIPAAVKGAKHDVARNQPRPRPEQPGALAGFFSLPYADDSSTIEYGVIVRLELSRSTLAWLGLSVPAADSNELIVADLFLNQSGTPEAIRFVR